MLGSPLQLRLHLHWWPLTMLNTDDAVCLSANSELITSDKYLYIRIQTTEHLHLHPHNIHIHIHTGEWRYREKHTDSERETDAERQTGDGGEKERDLFFSLHPHLTNFRQKMESRVSWWAGSVWMHPCSTGSPLLLCLSSALPSSCISPYQHDFYFNLWSVPEYKTRHGHRNLGLAWNPSWWQEERTYSTLLFQMTNWRLNLPGTQGPHQTPLGGKKKVMLTPIQCGSHALRCGLGCKQALI